MYYFIQNFKKFQENIEFLFEYILKKINNMEFYCQHTRL